MAINDELTSMEKNNVWKIVNVPKDVKLLKTKWIFKIKEDENGIPIRYKARLVAKGFFQKHGVDYFETYAPVAKLTTVRLILAYGIRNNFVFHHLDVKTAFLHGNLSEDIYMAIPDGIDKAEGNACKLLKSLYGLKQAPRCWNEKFNAFLLKLGFIRSNHDYSLYTKFYNNNVLIIVLYVDDLLIAGKNEAAINDLKRNLENEFEMVDCGKLKHFLGINIETQNVELSLTQESNIEKVLVKFRMEDCNTVRTPMQKGLQLQRNTENSQTNNPYRELLGSLMYIMLCCRPDLCYSIGFLGRYQQNPTDEHWQALKRLLRYLKGTKDMKLKYKCQINSERLIGYADADWASDITDRKSVSGFVFFAYGCPISWSSKKQVTVATSSSEAEYVAMSAATTEAIWLRGLLTDLGEHLDSPIKIFEDNRGCIGMATNLECKRSKHIDIKHHFIRDAIAKRRIELVHISSKKQLADIFTKSLDVSQFKFICSLICLD